VQTRDGKYHDIFENIKSIGYFLEISNKYPVLKNGYE
jgi:hypothetical protein